jgi:hypothetical protein
MENKPSSLVKHGVCQGHGQVHRNSIIASNWPSPASQLASKSCRPIMASTLAIMACERIMIPKMG